MSLHLSTTKREASDSVSLQQRCTTCYFMCCFCISDDADAFMRDMLSQVGSQRQRLNHEAIMQYTDADDADLLYMSDSNQVRMSHSRASRTVQCPLSEQYPGNMSMQAGNHVLQSMFLHFWRGEQRVMHRVDLN